MPASGIKLSMATTISLTKAHGWGGSLSLLECIIDYIQKETALGNVQSDAIKVEFSPSRISGRAVLEIRHKTLTHFQESDMKEFRHLLIRMRDAIPACALWWKSEDYSYFYDDVAKLIGRVELALEAWANDGNA